MFCIEISLTWVMWLRHCSEEEDTDGGSVPQIHETTPFKPRTHTCATSYTTEMPSECVHVHIGVGIKEIKLSSIYILHIDIFLTLSCQYFV